MAFEGLLYRALDSRHARDPLSGEGARRFDALRVPSFAPGAAAADVNLVLLRWGTAPPAQLRLVDDQGRLG